MRPSCSGVKVCGGSKWQRVGGATSRGRLRYTFWLFIYLIKVQSFFYLCFTVPRQSPPPSERLSLRGEARRGELASDREPFPAIFVFINVLFQWQRSRFSLLARQASRLVFIQWAFTRCLASPRRSFAAFASSPGSPASRSGR